MAAILLVTPASAFLITSNQQPVYEASADVLIGQSSFSTNAAGIRGSTDAERAGATQARLARLPAVAERVIASEGITNQTARDFLNHSSVSATSGADLLRFSVRNSKADQAAQLATAYAREYTRYRKSLESRSIADARSELRRRINQLRSAGRADSPLYRALVSSDEQLAAMEVLPDVAAVVVQPAVDATQLAPHPVRNGILGVGLGLLLAVSVAFFAEALDTRARAGEDTRVRAGEEVERRLRRPILGYLPMQTRSQAKKSMLMMFADPASTGAEAVRMLRASFDFARTESGARSVMFSSFGESEQKSATAGNLAIALARAGHDVILCDLDCRRPSIGGLFGVDGRVGITDVALDQSELLDALTGVEVGDVDSGFSAASTVRAYSGSLKVLPLGTLTPPSPADFVGSKAVARLLAELSKAAEIVLVEAPPFLAVSDAIALSASVDAIVLVTQLEGLRRGTLAAVERALASSSAALLGIVILGPRGMTSSPVDATRTLVGTSWATL